MCTLSCPSLIPGRHGLACRPWLRVAAFVCHLHSSIMIIIARQCWKCWVVRLPVDTVPVSPFFVISLLPPGGGGDGTPCELDVGLSPCLQQGPVAAGWHPCVHNAIGALAHLHVSRLRDPTCDLLRAHAVVSGGSPALKQALFLCMPIPRGASTTYTTPLAISCPAPFLARRLHCLGPRAT